MKLCVYVDILKTVPSDLESASNFFIHCFRAILHKNVPEKNYVGKKWTDFKISHRSTHHEFGPLRLHLCPLNDSFWYQKFTDHYTFNCASGKQ